MRRLTSFLENLRKRHIVQVGLIYLGIAWGLTEFTDFAVDNYQLSRKLLDVLLLLLVLGFPAALLLAWNHGEKGRQEATRTEILILTTLAVLAGIGTFRISTAGEVVGGGASGGSPDLGEGSLAVLPFTNSTGADSLDWLGPGMSDLVTSSLARIGGLSVVSPQRLFDLLREEDREETESIPDQFAMDIAGRSGARLMARGTILGAGEDLIVDVHLIELSDGTVVGAERVRGSDVFALADSIARRLGGQMLGAGAVPAEVRPDRSPLALTGDLEMYRRFQTDLRERWTSLDSTDIQGRYRLAALYEMMPGRSHERRQVLEEILTIDPRSAPALYQLAVLAVGRDDRRAADSLITLYGELQPDEPLTHKSLGELYEHAGEYEEARGHYLDVLADVGDGVGVLPLLTRTYLRENRPAAAREALAGSLEGGDPAVAAEARLLFADTYAWEGRFDEALDAYRQAERDALTADRADVASTATKAALDLEELLRSDRPSIFNRSLWRLLELERGERALDLIQAAEELHMRGVDRLVPVDHHVLQFARGWALELMGHPQLALRSYDEILDHWGAAITRVPLMTDAPERAAALR